jgi:hypothetical protein
VLTMPRATELPILWYQDIWDECSRDANRFLSVKNKKPGKMNFDRLLVVE